MTGDTKRDLARLTNDKDKNLSHLEDRDMISKNSFPRGMSLEEFEDLEERFDKAAEVIESEFSELENAVGTSLGEVDDTSYIRLVIATTPGIQTKFTDKGGVYYIVEPETAGFLGGAAQDIPEAAEIVREICASNVFEGAALPYSLRCAAVMIINGQISHLAKRRGPKLSGAFFIKWILYWATIHAHEAFGLKLTRREGENAMTAPDAVSLVAAQHGVAVKPRQIMEWLTHERYASMRNRADPLIAFFRGQMLRKQGILTTNEHPFGPLQAFAIESRSDN